MSASAQNCNCPCPNPEVVEIPGVEGENGANGQGAFSFTTDAFTTPPPGDNAFIELEDTSWLVDGAIIMAGASQYYKVTIINSDSVIATYLDIPQNTGFGVELPIGTKFISTGPPIDLAPMLQITDATGGTVLDVIEDGVGVTTLSFYIEAAALANGDILTNYIPGYKFQILSFDARCAKPVTTGAKAATLNLEIVATNLTGGVISLAGTYAQGAAQAGTTVTGNNSGTSTDSFSIEASSVTTFIEGAFWLIIRIKNMDVADGFASTLDRVNGLISQIT